MTAAAPTEQRKPRLVLVTGMSGAGRSSALKILEDLGYEAVDNMPLTLLGLLAGNPAGQRRDLAVGVDVRTRDFAVVSLLEGMDRLMSDGSFDVQLMFMDSSDDVLGRRFTETRRRHPLAADRPVVDGIAQERRMLAGLRERADIMVDTSDLALPGLRRLLEGHFRIPGTTGLVVFVTSFSYRHGVPREADLVFDVRFLANPHYEDDLRALTGLDAPCANFITRDPAFGEFFDALTRLLDVVLSGVAREGKSYLTIAIGCTGGRHRSVCVADRLTGWLRAREHTVDVIHRDMDKSRT